jgi:prophage regulatory protein
MQLSRLMRDGKFPQKIEISGGRIAWLETEIDAWIEAKAAARHA